MITHNAIPHHLKGNGGRLYTYKAHIIITKEVRLKFWKHITYNLNDSQIMERALEALNVGDSRFVFEAVIFDNPQKPARITLIDVKPINMDPFVVTFRYAKDHKWQEFLETSSNSVNLTVNAK